MDTTSSQTFDIAIEPSGPLGGYLNAPPSKNYSTRLILAAALAEGTSIISHAATNDDARALILCCRALGADIQEEPGQLVIRGFAGRPANPGILNPDNAGAVLRLLLGVACLIEGEIRFETHHAESLGKRPNEDLLTALRSLGAQAEGQGSDGRLPITIHAGRSRLKGEAVSISGARSSQFLSSLLYLTPHLESSSTIEVTSASPSDPPVLVSRPLINQTLEVLTRFGAKMDSSPDGFTYHVKGNQTLSSGNHSVNGDWPSAAALLSAVAVAGGMVGIRGLQADAQGERRAQDALAAMGCEFTQPEPDYLFIHSRGDLHAVEFNGDLATDAVLALVGAACLAEGTSRFTNIGNLKIKETDRIRVPLEELKKIGVQSRYGEDWIEITGRPEGYEGGIDVDCRGDHRIAQMLAIVGTRCSKGLTLRGAQCVSKSYPAFFNDFEQMGVKLKSIAS